MSSEGQYLVYKLILLYRLFGALRCGQFTALEWKEVTGLEMQTASLVTIRSSKTDKTGKGFEFIIPASLKHPELCWSFVFSL